MPLFYFDYTAAEDSSRDDEGTMLPNLAAARVEAAEAAVQWLKDSVGKGGSQIVSISVRNGKLQPEFEVVASVTFSPGTPERSS